jgi:hypothetical protein
MCLIGNRIFLLNSRTFLPKPYTLSKWIFKRCLFEHQVLATITLTRIQRLIAHVLHILVATIEKVEIRYNYGHG